ncbi:MAG: hypothetical protein A2157_10425 [Deltaproteobacteria bacterium RBG_16_47_11]|nr:MAG: hypothetical protein A2157_10425 [Deltaproteobacteria bacterium RBG_16_47_11]
MYQREVGVEKKQVGCRKGNYYLYAFAITILPKTKIRDRKPIPKTNVAAIIPINKILIFSPPY